VVPLHYVQAAQQTESTEAAAQGTVSQKAGALLRLQSCKFIN